MNGTHDAILITGGAGFIGSNLVLKLMAGGAATIVNLDKLTYAGNLKNLASILGNARHEFVAGDIGDATLVRNLLAKHRPRAVLNLAAESHVDRSIHSPAAFIQTNVVGTFTLLEEVRNYWSILGERDRAQFRFLHISTDEVYGSLAPETPPSPEAAPYAPNSPYAASKAAADHLVRSFHQTYGLPAITTNCSNNYGPYQFPEKLIPLMIINALRGAALPVYGDGGNIRDWLYVEDHCDAILRVLEAGRVGETYNVGGDCERTNLEVVHTLCDILDDLRPLDGGRSYRAQITFVQDRPGHDRRYAIDASKVAAELNWRPRVSLPAGLRRTVEWYLGHPEWIRDVETAEYRQWISAHYGTAAS
jgi:dTDP-glucose 4,6-dehydratase